MNAEISPGHCFLLFESVIDLPEALIAGREEIWLRFIFSTWCYTPEPPTLVSRGEDFAIREEMWDFREVWQTILEEKYLEVEPTLK